MSDEWDFAKTTGKCAVTERELSEGESYYAVLIEHSGGFERRDYSLEAWSGPPEGSFCFWRGRIPVREKKNQPIAIDQEVLMHLFLQLEDASSEIKQRFRFMLTLLLMRKRLLKLDKTVQDGDREYWQVRLLKDQSIHQVLNPDLGKEQVEQLSIQMTAILSGEVESIESLDQIGTPRKEIEEISENISESDRGDSNDETHDTPSTSSESENGIATS